MKILHSSLYLFCFVHLCATISIGQQVLTLEEAVNTGLSQNFDVLISKNNNDISKKNFTYGNAGFLPRLNTSISQTYTNSNSTLKFFNGTERSAKGAKSDALNASAALNWTVFDGFNMFVSYDRLRTMNEIQKINLKESIQQTILDIQKTYYQIVLQKKLLAALEQNIKMYEKIVDLVNSRLNIGTASKYDLMFSQVELNNYRANYYTQKTLLENAKIDLNTILSKKSEEEFDVVDTVVIRERMNKEGVNLALNNAVNLADNFRLMNTLDLKSTRAQFYPTVGLTANYNYIKSKSQIGQVLFNQTSGFTYGVVATWNLFDGFNNRTSYQVSKIAAINSDIAYKKSKLESESRLSQYYKTYTTNLEIFYLENENIKIAQQVSVLAIDRFNLGIISAFELQESQRSFIAAQNRFENARYKAKISELELLKLDGKIVEVKN